MSTFTLTSTAFEANQPVPRRYTGDGDDLSPPLAWLAPPAGTRELALIVDDPDAPTAEPWVHWLLYRLAPELTGLPEGVAPALRPAVPRGACQGRNSWPRGIGYRGPAPPHGHGLHHYRFRLYALDAGLNLEPGVDRQALDAAMAGHILAEAELVGTYQR